MFHVINSGEALQMILQNIPECNRTETVTLENSLGRICSEDICSGEDLPAFARSIVDGYAVLAEDTYGCSDSLPAMLICDGEIRMGEHPLYDPPHHSFIQSGTASGGRGYHAGKRQNSE